MTRNEYLKLLVEGIHSTTIATIGADGHPQTRVIDMMLYDERGVYFLTAKGKAFYAQLMERASSPCLQQRIKYRSLCGGRSGISAAKSWTRSLRRTPICRPSIPAIPVQRWMCSACMKRTVSILTLATRHTSSGTASPSAKRHRKHRATMWAKAASAASCATRSARRSASTLQRSLWRLTSTIVSTAGGVRKPALSKLSKRGFDYEPE